MPRAKRLLMVAVLAAIPILICVRADIWERPMRMDNRIYYYMAERAASGIPPHVSAPDPKMHLATLVDAVSIRAGRIFGIDDLHAGRLGTLLILVAGVIGVAMSLVGLGTTPAAATLGGIAAIAFSGLTRHTVYGYNPKILLFTLMAWVPFAIARGNFAAAGAVAAAATLCWQPAVAACIAAALAALVSARPLRSLVHCLAGGAFVVALYEAWFAWHGVLPAQLFQSVVLPLGSVHDAVDWNSGIEFVFFGELHGLDHYGIPAAAFTLVLAGALLSRLGLPLPGPGRHAASAPALVAVLVMGLIACWFTAYDHQAEPDRFILCASFAIAIGIVVDRAVRLFGRRASDAFRIEGAVALLVLLVANKSAGDFRKTDGTLEDQVTVAHIVAMYAEAYGSVWAYGCNHLLAFDHLTNHHPLDRFWDDLRRYFDEDTFEPLEHGRMPDVIVKCRALPADKKIMAGYSEVRAPGIRVEKARLYVRKELVDPLPREPQRQPAQGP